MGTWDEGMLNNDCSADGLGEVVHWVIEDIQSLGATTPGARSTGRLGAAVGVLLQLPSSYYLSAQSEKSKGIIESLQAHEEGIRAHLPPAAQRILARVVAGEGPQLAERQAKMPAKLFRALHKDGKVGMFGRREPSLFDSPSGAAYVKALAKRCVKMIDEDFKDEDVWSDLCREAWSMGPLALLLVLEPCSVPPTKLARWRRSAAKGLALLEANEDDELDFQRPYYANVDVVFAKLLRRFE